MQAVLADKDAELARQYKRMERDANERSGLRSQYTTTLDEVKALRTDLEEARQAMLELKVCRVHGTWCWAGGAGGGAGRPRTRPKHVPMRMFVDLGLATEHDGCQDMHGLSLTPQQGICVRVPKGVSFRNG